MFNWFKKKRSKKAYVIKCKNGYYTAENSVSKNIVGAYFCPSLKLAKEEAYYKNDKIIQIEIRIIKELK